MHLSTHIIVYPEGDQQEIDFRLSFGDLVGLNGVRLTPPLSSPRILAYRVYKIRRQENRGEDIHYYHLEQVFPGELAQYL